MSEAVRELTAHVQSVVAGVYFLFVKHKLVYTAITLTNLPVASLSS